MSKSTRSVKSIPVGSRFTWQGEAFIKLEFEPFGFGYIRVRIKDHEKENIDSQCFCLRESDWTLKLIHGTHEVEVLGPALRPGEQQPVTQESLEDRWGKVFSLAAND